MLRLSQAVVVEGKYDKITLENILDATIIPTNGFGIFKDKSKCMLLQRIAKKCGIIVMTDSDSAGALIRSHLKQICPENTITNVYIPQLKGKEKRKDRPSKQGFLGVEGMTTEIIVSALQRSGIVGCDTTTEKKRVINKTDFYVLGLSGVDDCSARRDRLARYLDLPLGMSSNAFLDAVNAVFSYDEFIEAVNLWHQEEVKK